MTRDEILAMEAGPELDSLVGEWVMGGTMAGDFKPSTNIDYAMQALETVRITYGETVHLIHGPQNSGTENWYVEFTKPIGIGEAAPTLPLAICYASLITVLFLKGVIDV